MAQNTSNAVMQLRWLAGRSEMERDGDYPIYREQWEKIRPAECLATLFSKEGA